MENFMDVNKEVMTEDNKYNKLLEEKNYSGLLEYSDELLNKNPEDTQALEMKGRVLISLEKYDEAEEIFVNLNKKSLKSQNLIFLDLVRKLKGFGKKYEKSLEKFSKIPDSWAEDKLNIEVNKIKEKFPNMKPSEIHGKIFPTSDYFILGDKSIVNVFDGYEGSAWMSFNDRLKYPFAQVGKDGMLFSKVQNYLLPFEEGTPFCVAPFPVYNISIPSQVFKPNSNCDVYVAYDLIDKTTHRMIEFCMDRLATQTKDYFVPKYHNIIDPNLTATKQGDVHKWTATDVLIEEQSQLRLTTLAALQLSSSSKNKKMGKFIVETVGKFLPKEKTKLKGHFVSPISNMEVNSNQELYVAVEAVFNAALPILAQLRRPALVLPGKLQAVVKGQRIFVKEGEEYEGIWHRDGKNEDIVAVVIYYYRVSDSLVGGDLEFVDKRPLEEIFWDREGLNEVQARYEYENMLKCRLKVKKGTLVVFSNYQLIHRVLRMTCNGSDPKSPDGFASRDFLLFFIVDQKDKLASTSTLTTLTEDNYKMRENLFKDQIKPIGRFGVSSSYVSSTGNGSATEVGWFDEMKAELEEEENYLSENYRGYKAFYNMNRCPPFGRGLSWAFECDENPEK